MLLAKNRGFKLQNFADQARNFIKASKRVKSVVLMACNGTLSMKKNSSAKSLVRLSFPSDSINDWAKHICACFFEILPDSASYWKMLVTNTI